MGVAVAALFSLLPAANAVAATASPATTAATTTPPSSSGPPRVTFGLEPATASGPDGRPNLAYSVTPGATVFDHVAALNYSAVPVALEVYATDAIETSGGGFGLLAGKGTDVGSWVSIPPADASVNVPARSATGPGVVVIPIATHVPLQVTPGDHSGAVLVVLSTVGRNRSGQNVVLNQRTGTRLLILVSGKVGPQLSLTDVQASYSGTANPVGRGNVLLHYTVTNLGNVNLSVTLAASISGLFGAQVHLRLPDLTYLLPNAVVHVTALVPGVWPQGLLHASVTAAGRTLRSVPAPAPAPAPAPVRASVTIVAIPWTLVLVVVAVLVALIAWIRRRGRRRSSSMPPHAPEAEREREKVPA